MTLGGFSGLQCLLLQGNCPFFQLVTLVYASPDVDKSVGIAAVAEMKRSCCALSQRKNEAGDAGNNMTDCPVGDKQRSVRLQQLKCTTLFIKMTCVSILCKWGQHTVEPQYETFVVGLNAVFTIHSFMSNSKRAISYYESMMRSTGFKSINALSSPPALSLSS